MRRRIEIITETERELVITSRLDRLIFCEACGRRVQMITAEQAAAQAGITVRAVYRRVEADRVHFIETAEGRLLICVNSV